MGGSAEGCFVPRARAPKISATVDAVAPVDVTEATEAPSLHSPRMSAFGRMKKLELERGNATDSLYQPADHTNAEVLKKAMLEFDRRLREEDTVRGDDATCNWVLVSTNCGKKHSQQSHNP